MKMRKMLLVLLLAVLLVSCAGAGIVGDWSFEEGSGQWTANAVAGQPDLRRGSSDSAWQDAEWSTNGYSGNCFHFMSYEGRPDGTIDFLRPTSAGDVSAFNTTSFTIDARINLDLIPEGSFDWYNPYTIISFGGKDSTSANKDAYFLRVTKRADGVAMLNGYYYSDDGVGHSFSHSAHLVTGQWYHIGFSHDGSTTTDNTSIWVDGVEETSSSASHPRTDLTLTGESLVVGAMWTRQRGFNGLIDEMKVYDSVVPVPEPVTVALLAVGACLGTLRRSKKNRR